MGRITVKVHLDLDLVMTFFGDRVNCGKKERKDNTLELGASLSPFPGFEECYKTDCHGYRFKR